MGKKRLKKIAIIISIVLVILWFLSNLGIYLFFKSLNAGAANEGKGYGNVPEKLVLKGSASPVKPLPLMGISIGLPVFREEIKTVSPMFLNGELNGISIFIRNPGKIQVLSMSFFPNEARPKNRSVKDRILEWLFVPRSFFELTRASEYARYQDLSWWNLVYNVRLSQLLILKGVKNGGLDGAKVYDVETPTIHGILTEINRKERGGYTLVFVFTDRNRSYSLAFFGVKDDFLPQVMDLFANINLISDKTNSYHELEKEYAHKEHSRYPEELLSTSMMALKKPSVDDLKKLLSIMESKQYKDWYIEHIKETIRDLEKK